MTATRQQSLEAILGYRVSDFLGGMILGDLLAGECEPPFMELFGHARIASPCLKRTCQPAAKHAKTGDLAIFGGNYP